jgi:hypothetical protein
VIEKTGGYVFRRGRCVVSSAPSLELPIATARPRSLEPIAVAIDLKDVNTMG